MLYLKAEVKSVRRRGSKEEEKGVVRSALSGQKRVDDMMLSMGPQELMVL